MKTFRLFAAALIAGLLFAPSANAATYSAVTNFGTVNEGNGGELWTEYTNDYVTNFDYVGYGILPSGLQIEFTLTATPAYMATVTSAQYQTRTAADDTLLGSAPYSPLVNMTTVGNSLVATLVIANFTQAAQTFAGEINAIIEFMFTCAEMKTVVSYNVSAVPLPGAALLFGSGLMGLVGFARKKARR